DNASVQVGLPEARTIMRKAFATWENAECPEGGHPHVHVTDLGPVSCDKLEYNKQGGAGNVSIVVFRDTFWPHPDKAPALALTTVSFDPTSGAIVDADMEINTADFQFTTDGSGGNDLLAVVTHEAGHFLGLAHTNLYDGTPTMTANYDCASSPLAFRDLAPD